MKGYVSPILDKCTFFEGLPIPRTHATRKGEIWRIKSIKSENLPRFTLFVGQTYRQNNITCKEPVKGLLSPLFGGLSDFVQM